jgi:hypothetical protein
MEVEIMKKLIFIIVTSGLLMVGAITTNLFVSNNYSKQMNQEGGHNYITSAGNRTGNLSLNISLPSENVEIKVYNLVVPKYQVSQLNQSLDKYYPNWRDTDMKMLEMPEINATRFSKFTDVIFIEEAGRLRYTNKTALDKWKTCYKLVLDDIAKGDNVSQNNISDINGSANETTNSSSLKTDELNAAKALYEKQISKDDAYNISLNYIQSHGGLPDNNYLSFSGHALLGYLNWEIPSYFAFRFQRKVDGYPIVGSGGDCANVKVTPLGDIYEYSVLWREFSDSFEKITVKNATAAFVSLESSVRGNWTIEHIELGYYSADAFKIISKSNPVWIFYTDKNRTNYFCVDAINLKLCL